MWNIGKGYFEHPSTRVGNEQFKAVHASRCRYSPVTERPLNIAGLTNIHIVLVTDYDPDAETVGEAI